MDASMRKFTKMISIYVIPNDLMRKGNDSLFKEKLIIKIFLKTKRKDNIFIDN